MTCAMIRLNSRLTLAGFKRRRMHRITKQTLALDVRWSRKSIHGTSTMRCGVEDAHVGGARAFSGARVHAGGLTIERATINGTCLGALTARARSRAGVRASKVTVFRRSSRAGVCDRALSRVTDES